MDNNQKVEVCRSFSAKINTGDYTNKDFFMSCKAEISFGEAEAVANELYHFCKTVVEQDIAKFIEDNKPENEKVIDINAPVYDNKPTRKFTQAERDEFEYKESLADNYQKIKKGD